MRERRQRAEERATQKAKEDIERMRTYSPGDKQKNTRLMLDALGVSLRRRMIARLAREGTMSLSKLAEPYGITLPSALAQLRILERAGIVTTRKQGRVRLCVYNGRALKELATSLGSNDILHSLD